MELPKTQLDASTILEKKFKTGMRGYNQVEVDEFLDRIIKDYEIFNQTLNTLQLENERLKRRQDQQPRTQATQPVQQVNYDVLKRLSNLEKEVFGKKIVDA